MLKQYAVLRAIEVLLKQPNKRFSISSLAKEAGMAPSAASYSLGYMKKKGLVRLDIVGPTHQYHAELDNPLARHWKILISLDEIGESGFVQDVLKKMGNVIAIVLYGSVAAGTDDAKSDIDVIIIADTRKTGAAFEKAEIGGRDLNVSVYTPLEWRRKAHAAKAFYDNVIIDGIALYGGKPVVL